jgi:hypothetical protein
MDAYYVHIPEGKIFVDEDGTLYQGSYDEDHGYVDYPGIKPSGKTLRPYKAITIANNDDNRNDILLLSSGNRLGYAKTDRTIANGKALGACRAYFDIPAGSGAQAARQFTLNFGDDEDTQTTGIIGHTDSTDFTDKADAIYDLQGRKVEKPKKGLYIVNGKKVVIK